MPNYSIICYPIAKCSCAEPTLSLLQEEEGRLE